MPVVPGVIAVCGVVSLRARGGRGGCRVVLVCRMRMAAGDRRVVVVRVAASLTVAVTVYAGFGCHWRYCIAQLKACPSRGMGHMAVIVKHPPPEPQTPSSRTGTAGVIDSSACDSLRVAGADGHRVT